MTTLGIHAQITDRTIQVGRIARLLSERGYASLFVSEHTNIPVGSKSISPTGSLPEWVKRIPDPYVTLAAAAATADIEIGTCVALPAEHDPIALAKAIATLDQLSGGRFVFGVGWGWNREEFENSTGLSARERVPVMIEKIRAMQQIWRSEEAEHHGEYVRMERLWSWPKPASPGGPSVLVGASGIPRNLQRIADWADGWIPQAMALCDEAFPLQLEELRRIWKEAERDSAGPDITVLHPPGSVDDIRRVLERAAHLGVKRVLVQINEQRMTDFEAIVDEMAPATFVS